MYLFGNNYFVMGYLKVAQIYITHQYHYALDSLFFFDE